MSHERINHTGVRLDLTRNWFGTSGTRDVFPPDEDNWDPAIERKIDLYKLTPILNRIRNAKLDATMIFMVFRGDHFASDPGVAEVRQRVLSRLRELRDLQNSGELERLWVVREDVMGVVANDLESQCSVSGYDTAYPVPALLEGVFGIDDVDYSPVSYGELSRMFVDEGFCRRVIFLPRVRSRKWCLDGDVGHLLFEHLLPDEEGLQFLQKFGLEGGLLSGEGGRVMFRTDHLGFTQMYPEGVEDVDRTIFSLPEISDEEIIAAGIPIMR
ncbi:MAG: hypothetical protein JXB49_17575 [Bacteroidales bacterium]|nr:hypothetical protein [Bacteroidales bacterium]